MLGYITEWRFVAANSLVYGLHLAVFRPHTEYPGAIRFVSETYFQALTTPQAKDNVWIYYPVEQGLPVQQGDIIGMFYDRFETVQRMLTISSQVIDKPKSSDPPTYAFIMDVNDIRRDPILTLDSAEPVFRKPALMAVVSSNRTGGGSTVTVGPDDSTTDSPSNGDDYTEYNDDPQVRCTSPPTAMQVCNKLQMRAYFDQSSNQCRML